MIRSANRPVEDASVLFVGAGRHQRRALVRLRELGVRVVAVDRNPEAPGIAIAEVGQVVDVLDIPAVVEAGRRHGVDGVMTYAADRAVPVVAAVAEALDLPGIGTETAHLMTNKIAMRRQLADAGDYDVVVVNPARHPHVKAAQAQQFADWIVSPTGQAAIADYKIGGEQLFFSNAGH